MYDVLIIGAGPTGCTAAKILAENGCKVLLAERCKLPRYKSCSGQLIQKTLDLVQMYFGEPVPLSAACVPTENKGMIFTDDRGREFRFEQAGLNVWRSTFDYWLAQKAVQSGAELRDGTAVLECSEAHDAVTVGLKGKSAYTEQAKYVLDCAGVTDTLKRKLLGKTAPYITTYQTFNRGSINLDYHYFYAYLQPALSEYDAWFNVKENRLVLGVAVKDQRNIPLYYNRFVHFLQANYNLQMEAQLKAEKWLMPHIRPDCIVDYGKGRVLFAGEAAGFLNPMGEGISAALESGFAAAKAVLQNFGNADSVCAAYKENTETLCSYMRRQWDFTGRMSETFREMRI